MSAHRDRPPLEMGQLLGGKYKLVKLLGEGGMSVVYQAVDITVDRVVAIKVIRPSIARRREYSTEQIRREAETLVKLHAKTEHVVDVLTAGITEDASRLPYYVMERLEGDPLRRYLLGVLTRGVVLTIEEAVAIALPVSLALMYAHLIGVIHRDIKPENIFMATARGGESLVKVLDFGICALVDGADEGGGFTGTLPNAAPEQLEGQRPTPATDVYALGLLMHELLVLKLPHGRESRTLTPASLAVQVMAAPIPDVLAARLDTPERLARLIERCLTWDPKERPSAHEVAKTLRDIQHTLLGAFSASGARTDVSDPPPEALRRPDEPSSPQLGARVNRIADDKPVDLFAPTLTKDRRAGGSKVEGDEVFFRASDLPDITVPDAAPFRDESPAASISPAAPPTDAAAVYGPSITAEWHPPAIVPSPVVPVGDWNEGPQDAATGTANASDTVFVDIDGSRELPPIVRRGGPAPEPSSHPPRSDVSPAARAWRQPSEEPIAESLEGAARSENQWAPPHGRNVRERAVVGMGFAAPILIGIAVYGFYAHRHTAQRDAAMGSPPPLSAASATIVPPPTPSPSAGVPSLTVTAAAADIPVGSEVAPAGTSAAHAPAPHPNDHHRAGVPAQHPLTEHGPASGTTDPGSAAGANDEFRPTMDNPLPSSSTKGIHAATPGFDEFATKEFAPTLTAPHAADAGHAAPGSELLK